MAKSTHNYLLNNKADTGGSPLIETSFNTGHLNLHCLQLGDDSLPPLIMIHGIRDLSWGLLPVAEKLSTQYHVFIPDLRGHGRSDHTGGYSMDAFLGDLYQLFEHFKLDKAVLFGHSLGGHITSRFAALFPEKVYQMIMVEGFGPPANLTNPESDIHRYRHKLLHTINLNVVSPTLKNTQDAEQRLIKNNPRMSEDLALLVAEKGTIRDSAGILRWRFDPRVQQVFVSERLEETARFWAEVQCPTLIVMGKLSIEYWARMGITQDYESEDLHWRVNQFQNSVYVCFDNSGHMVPYDEPDKLADTTINFLETTK